MIAIPAYLFYAFPILLIYGTIASLISEYLVMNLETYANLSGKPFLKTMLLCIFHLAFGLIFLYASLLAALLFFLADQWLARMKKVYRLSSALISFLIPFMLYLILYFGFQVS